MFDEIMVEIEVSQHCTLHKPHQALCNRLIRFSPNVIETEIEVRQIPVFVNDRPSQEG